MVKLKVVEGGKAKPTWPPSSLAEWARVELSALATIEDAARRSAPVPDVFPHAFIPPRLRAVYSAIDTELDFWTILTKRERRVALRYYWLGLIMATVTLHPTWWSALNKILMKLTREEKQNVRTDDAERRRRRTRATGRTHRRTRAR